MIKLEKQVREFVDAYYLEANDEYLLDELKEDDSLNMPCDTSGCCIGADCSRYYKCN